MIFVNIFKTVVQYIILNIKCVRYIYIDKKFVNILLKKNI